MKGNGKPETPGRCRHCNKFTKRRYRSRAYRLYCNATCYGLGQRGRSRSDRTSPAKKEYIQIRNENNERGYLHRYIYRQNNGPIPEGFVIHHANEIKPDNRPENLEAKPRNEHTPHAHYHWKTRAADPDRFVPIGKPTGEFDEFGF